MALRIYWSTFYHEVDMTSVRTVDDTAIAFVMYGMEYQVQCPRVRDARDTAPPPLELFQNRLRSSWLEHASVCRRVQSESSKHDCEVGDLSSASGCGSASAEAHMGPVI